MKLQILGISLAALSVVAISGCASINSTPTTEPGDGLVYYMPKKDIVVTVVREATKATATIQVTAAYPDLDRPYVLNFNRNLLGKNEMNVGIGPTGLLKSAKSTTTSGIAEALKNLATSIGTAHGTAAAPQVSDKPEICPVGTFTYLLEARDDMHRICGANISIRRLAASKPTAKESTAGLLSGGGAGIFYRQMEAYRVDVKGDKNSAMDTSSIELSPSLAPVRFLPIEKSLFANNTADFGFDDGIPTKYDQEADGELIALFKLPADVIGAYFAAVGKMFGSTTTNSNAEVAAMAADVQLQQAKLKYGECIQALKDKNDTLVQQLGCGK